MKPLVFAEMGKRLLEEGGLGQAEDIRSSVLDMLSLKCLLHIQGEMLRR